MRLKQIPEGSSRLVEMMAAGKRERDERRKRESQLDAPFLLIFPPDLHPQPALSFHLPSQVSSRIDDAVQKLTR